MKNELSNDNVLDEKYEELLRKIKEHKGETVRISTIQIWLCIDYPSAVQLFDRFVSDDEAKSLVDGDNVVL